MRRDAILLAGLAILCLWARGCSTSTAKEDAGDLIVLGAGWKCQQRAYRIEGELPRSPEMESSPDLRRFAYVSMDPDCETSRVTLDGKRLMQYQNAGGLAFSPDSKRFAFVAEWQNGAFAVIDGVEGPKFEGSIYKAVFSPDSRHIVYTVRLVDSAIVVVDGQQYRHSGSFWDLVFSPDSQHWAYAVGDIVVVDGQQYRHSGFADDLVFSPDSQHWAYAVGKGRSTAVYLDGRKLLEADKVARYRLTFSPDSSKLVCSIRRGAKWFVAFGDQVLGPYDEVDDWEVRPDSMVIGISAKVGGKWFIFCGNETAGPFERVSWLTFSPDGKSVLVVGENDKKASILFNWKTIATVESVGKREFSPDGKHFVFTARQSDGEPRRARKDHFLFVDGSRKAIDGDVGEFLHSPDAQRLVAFVTKHKQERVVEGERPGKAYAGITSLCFSPDSRHLAYMASDGDKSVVVVDGEEAMTFHGEAGGELRFSREGHLFGICGAISEKDERALESASQKGRQEQSLEARKAWRIVLFELWRQSGRGQ